MCTWSKINSRKRATGFFSIKTVMSILFFTLSNSNLYYNIYCTVNMVVVQYLSDVHSVYD